MAPLRIPSTLCTLFLAASAQTGYNVIAGPYKPGPANNPQALQAIETAGRSPNLTDSVTFTRTYNNTPESWTWRINITSLAVPDTRIDDLGGEDNPSADYSQGLHVANTQWELQWPGDSPTLGSFLSQRGMNLSVQTLLTVLPPNVTQSYNPTDNGDCTSVLGADCARAIAQSASADYPVDFARLRTCDGPLNAMGGSGSGGGGFSDGSNLDGTHHNRVQRIRHSLRIPQGLHAVLPNFVGLHNGQRTSRKSRHGIRSVSSCFTAPDPGAGVWHGSRARLEWAFGFVSNR